ncbi:glycosyltransferase family 4 protein [Anthocerotibacter panamensis]|uniref:glycosyltransferase family 4 protein n=1 Tax=Anthocerotibacter panamensis TaxID=2857077 RepID=UPI001C402B55|nr:glycosyltransferase family 1 protein [Anthocerotibacter panamensis]
MKIQLYGDLLEEQRRSMEVCATYLKAALSEALGSGVECLIPSLTPLLGRVLPAWDIVAKTDLLLNRHFLYPLRTSADLHHVIDHSYAHLLHHLPQDRTVVTCHDLNILYRRQKSRNPLFHLSCDHILSGLDRAQWVICDSEFTKVALEKSGLAAGATVIVIPPGLSASFRVLSPTEIAEVAHRYKIPSGPTLIHVGDCFERKNIEALLQITAHVRAHVPVRLLKVGGVFTPAQQGLIAHLGLAEHLTHLAHVPLYDLVALYNFADVCVFPSWLEGFGFPVLEAMACGTPVVASNCSSLPEVVQGAGFLADPAAIESFVEPIVRLLSDPEDASGWSENGLRWVKQFTWQKHAEKTLQVYEKIMVAA